MNPLSGAQSPTCFLALNIKVPYIFKVKRFKTVDKIIIYKNKMSLPQSEAPYTRITICDTEYPTSFWDLKVRVAFKVKVKSFQKVDKNIIYKKQMS